MTNIPSSITKVILLTYKNAIYQVADCVMDYAVIYCILRNLLMISGTYFSFQFVLVYVVCHIMISNAAFRSPFKDRVIPLALH